MSFPTLDEITLFYHTRSYETGKTSSGAKAIQKWVEDTKRTDKLAPFPQSKTKSKAKASIFSGSTSSRSCEITENVSTISALSSSIAVVSKSRSKRAKEDTEGKDEIDDFGLGGLSDHDEMHGTERASALRSPKLPMARVKTKVHPFIYLFKGVAILFSECRLL